MDGDQNTALPIVTDCGGCGVCCLHMGYPSYIHDADGQADEVYWQLLPRDLKDELLAYVARYQHPAHGQLDGPCFWLDLETRRCKHHQHRPRVCRDFEVGCDDCLAWRRHYEDRIEGQSAAQ